jgi:nucleotide-binding universal stress UspA family protein
MLDRHLTELRRRDGAVGRARETLGIGFAPREKMFNHLLVPTDGSALSAAAARMAVGVAKAFDAKITGIHVIPEFHLLTYDSAMLADTEIDYARHARILAKEYLAFIEQIATAADVPCATTWVVGNHPYRAIIDTAQARHCDLIVMASHGRRGMQGLLIGSEAQKVLTHSGIPVLVYRGQ